MIILISPEKDIPNEIEVLEQLFQRGLNYYHLRKPQRSQREYEGILKQIDEKFYSRIMIHHYHHLAKEFGLKGIHLQEQFRVDLKEGLQEYVKGFSSEGFMVSSSFHHPDMIKNSHVLFDYHLLSPIFDAISKKGYHGREFSVHDIDKTIIGMGGVTANNLSELKAKGYKGAGVLGGVWNQEDKIKAFEELINKSDFNE